MLFFSFFCRYGQCRIVRRCSAAVTEFDSRTCESNMKVQILVNKGDPGISTDKSMLAFTLPPSTKNTLSYHMVRFKLYS